MSDLELDVLIDSLFKYLLDLSSSFGLAESCTGGLISSMVTAVPGASRVFRGGIVSYHGDIKKDLLCVSRATMLAHGQVSLPVARQMAHGARRALGCDFALSVTGIAGPGGGTEEKPVGTVCFAVAGPGVDEALVRRFKGAQRQDIQEDAAQFAIRYLWQSLKSDY